MDFKTSAEMIEKLNRAGQEWIETYREEAAEFLKKEETSPEENLQKEIILELMEHIYGINHIAEYLKRVKVRDGFLERDEEGEIRFNGEILPLMTELEVYIFDEFMEREIWTRTYVGGVKKEQKYLVGLDRMMEIKGIRARIRE